MRKMKIANKFVSILIISMLFISCGKDYTPKPHGYIRFDLPEKNYIAFQDSCPFSFEIGQYVKVIERKKGGLCWKNLVIKPCKATIHLSYRNVGNDLPQLLEDAHSLVYSHSVKADAINERVFLNPSENVYGIMYEIKGDAASNIQFIATDSVEHYLRGALYFNAPPNEDSLAPLIKYVKEDIEHLIETLHWE